MTTASTGDAPLSAPDHPERRHLSRAMVVLLVGYVAVILVIMVARGAYMSPDLFIVFALVIAVVLGRTRLFLRDWLPFAAIFLAWESMRGLADELGAAVHSDDVIALERFVFFGRVPSEELQAAFHVSGQVNLLDLGTTFLYVAHFALPLTVAFVFWVLERRLFYRYLLALMLMSFAAFICYLLIPVAPPRFAGEFGESLAVTDIARDTFTQLHFAPVTTWLYGSISGNPVAAFPSLHSAYPLLVYLFARRLWPRGFPDPACLERGHLVLGGVPGTPLRCRCRGRHRVRDRRVCGTAESDARPSRRAAGRSPSEHSRLACHA